MTNLNRGEDDDDDDDDVALEAPTQAIILAAGRGVRLAPYTDQAPTALISIDDKPLVAHSVEVLRRQGVTKFAICRGWQGDAFDAHLESLGPGVTLVDCPMFSSTGMLESLRHGLRHMDPGGFYVLYGDIIFRPGVAKQLKSAAGHLSVVVNASSPRIQSKAAADFEAVATSLEDPVSKRAVRRIGKNRGLKEQDIAGEFAGLIKFSSRGRALADAALARLYQEGAPCQLPWWLQPIRQASLCDLMQLFADEGAKIIPTVIFGGWHELNTPQDLARARNDAQLFLSEEDARSQVAAMGSCLLAEANDLKRPLAIVAKELSMSLAKLECLIRGDLEVSDALEVLRRMSEVYPVPLSDLWLDADDTAQGVRVFTAEAGEASARILTRPDAKGEQTPYYEYRDAVMSRWSQFRPEWIKELRVVQSGDPLDPDVQLNNGHLMMQTTLFIGPVDFYWKDHHGTVHRQEMNTGDSNFISPFVPHSFTARSPDLECLIIAVTYGGKVRRAFTEFSRLGAEQVLTLAGDKRDPELTRRCVMQRHLDSECMTVDSLAAAVAEDIAAERVAKLITGQEPKLGELEVIARALNVTLSDLYVRGMSDSEEVVVTRARDSRAQARLFSTYVLSPLARTCHQPDLKTFDLEVLDSAAPGESLRCGLHTFVYHFGSEAVELTWTWRDRRHSAVLRPGDSAYVAPLCEHRFSVCAAQAAQGAGEPRSNPNGSCCGEGRRLFLVRIPGHLSTETLSEFATFSAHGRERVGRETVQWY